VIQVTDLPSFMQGEWMDSQMCTLTTLDSKCS
jgi:hypothetical protein